MKNYHERKCIYKFELHPLAQKPFLPVRANYGASQVTAPDIIREEED